MEPLNSFWEDAAKAIPYVGIATVGSAIQALKGEWRGWKNFFLSVFSAGFGSFVIGMSASDMGISPGWAYFIAGMIGYSGGKLVDECLSMTTSKLEKVVGEKAKEND